MPTFRFPQINLCSRNLSCAATLYLGLCFVETFRTLANGKPVHIELTLDGFTLGIATMEAALKDHGLRPQGDGRWIEIVHNLVHKALVSPILRCSCLRIWRT
jgi:hypothetical protein